MRRQARPVFHTPTIADQLVHYATLGLGGILALFLFECALTGLLFNLKLLGGC